MLLFAGDLLGSVALRMMVVTAHDDDDAAHEPYMSFSVVQGAVVVTTYRIAWSRVICYVLPSKE